MFQRIFVLCLVVLLAVPVGAQESRREERRERPERRAEPPRTPKSVPEHRPERERDLERGTVRTPDATEQRTREPAEPPTPRDSVAPGMPIGGWAPGDFYGYEEHLFLDCESVRVCQLEPIEAYAAWMIAGQTTFPWKAIVDARIEEGSWAGAARALVIRPWEIYAAFDRRGSTDRYPTDPFVRDLAEDHLDDIVAPTFRCTFPVELHGVSAEEIDRRTDGALATVDWVDREIAARIEEETGWCADELVEARRFLGSWPRVARQLYLSPFLFEASFGISLRIQSLGTTERARYPLEEEIRHVVEADLWPENRS
jgi:hypothetical protein